MFSAKEDPSAMDTPNAVWVDSRVRSSPSLAGTFVSKVKWEPIDRGSSNKSATTCLRKDVAEVAAAEKLMGAKSEEEDRSQLRPDIVSSSKLAKEESENFELSGLSESSLVKLKRKIRLKLLAEEARNSSLHLAAEGFKNYNPDRHKFDEDGALPRITRAITSSYTSDRKSRLMHHHCDGSEPRLSGPEPGSAAASLAKVSKGVVDLSSDSDLSANEENEEDVSDPPFMPKKHLNSQKSQKFTCLPASEHHSHALQKLLSPLHSQEDQKIDKSMMLGNHTYATLNPSALLPGATYTKNCRVHQADPGLCKGQTKVTSSRKGGSEIIDMKLSKKTAEASARQSKTLKQRKEKDALQDTAQEYEQERDDNIRRNKAFLEALNLPTTLETVKQKKNACGRIPKTTALALVTETEGKIEDIICHNKDSLERSQISSTLSGSWGSIDHEPLNKKPRLLSDDDDDYGLERPIGRPKKRGKGKRKQNEKEQKTRGRGKKLSPVAAPTENLVSFTNQELIRFVSELLASKVNPPELEGDVAPKSKHKISRKKSSGLELQRGKAAPVRLIKEDNLSRSRARKKKDTWLTMIPFETPKTEYELERDEILRNRKDQFERLGIVSELIEEPAPPRQTRSYCRRWSSEPDPTFQRQTRLRDRLRNGSTKEIVEVKQENISSDDTETTLEGKLQTSFGPSMIANFCNGGKFNTGSYPERNKCLTTGLQVAGFRPREDGHCLDPLMTKIYTMDLGPITGSYICQNALLAAGGSQGRIAVFPVSPDLWSRRELTDDKGQGVAVCDRDAPKTPLLSWSVDSNCISQVIFLSDQFQESEMLLLSSSNDGRVVLWDINKVRVKGSTCGLSQEGMPRVVCQTCTLHSGGIFGMDELNGRMATSSENNVGISTIRETMIFMERSIAGHHSGVIQSVRFRDKNILADCGVDTIIGFLDLRSPDPCSLKIQTAHKTGMSMIEWSPASENILLSASHDPQLYLHDIRNPGMAFLQKLEGHVHPRRAKCYSVYRPAFVADGHGVVTPGEGTQQLSLYSVETGSTVSKIHVGYDATVLLWNNFIPNDEGGLWAGSIGISQLRPVWQLPSDLSA